MMQQKTRRFAALLLAALSLALSACAAGDKPDDPPPTVSGPSSPSPDIDPDSVQDSEIPSYSTSPSPQAGPSQSEDPTPSQSEDPAPSQSEDPSPSQSEDPSPSQSEAPSETPSGLMVEGEDVGNDWFADAVFLGDSRTDGLRLYSGIKGASFICHTGLSVFTVGSNACIKSDGTKITAMDALAKQQYAKVYLMLGVNELGYSTTAFQKAYTKVVEEIKELQPGAAIYLQTLIPVNEPIAYQNGTNRAINNEKLKQFNEVIAAVAQNEDVCLVNVDVPFWSVDGCLAAENTGDGVHLTKAGYKSWYAYLRTHTHSGETITFEPPEPSVEGWEVPEYTVSPESDALPDSTPPGQSPV